MIKVKHLMETAEESDGQRLWVEPHGLCHDLRQWCQVDHVLPHLGPPVKCWNILQQHPEAYDFFRAQYHEKLRKSQYRAALQSLACVSRRETFTLIHASEDDEHNSAIALYEYLSELEAYCNPE
jgi:uncharacterized protein YeaO (DUF488 family)